MTDCGLFSLLSEVVLYEITFILKAATIIIVLLIQKKSQNTRADLYCSIEQDRKIVKLS